MKAMKQECFFNKQIPDIHDVRRRDYEDLEDDQGKKKKENGEKKKLEVKTVNWTTMTIREPHFETHVAYSAQIFQRYVVLLISQIPQCVH